MIKNLANILFIMLVTVSIFGSVVAIDVKTDKDETETKKICDEAEKFLEEWKKAEKNGVHSYQMKEALEKLKIYKDELEELEANTDILHEIESEIHWLEYAIDSVKRRNVEAIPFPQSETLDVILYPNYAFCDGFEEGSSYAVYDAYIFDVEGEGVAGRGIAKTDSGYPFGNCWACTDIGLRITCFTSFVGIVKFKGHFSYKFISFEIGIVEPIISTVNGHIKARKYIYDWYDDAYIATDFVDIDTEPSIYLGILSFGYGEKNWQYSTSIPNYGFIAGRTYDIGVFVDSWSETAGFARSIALADWYLEEIVFTD